ncbi:MAG: helix-turn-helix domain-containing protein [Polyangiaceae bacterium]|nr:helix-turn-helix domain-containing protein [Polyangiaceae bacterium]
MSDFGETRNPPPYTLPPPPDNPGVGARVRRVIAVGGGRGGVGKTLLSVNLAVYFAQLGREVVLCDADPFGSSMFTVLGLVAPPVVSPDAAEEGAVEPVTTSVPGLRLMPVAIDTTTMTQVRPSRAAHWFRQIQSLNVDYVILHLGASTTPATLEMFSNADVGICVTAPEPLAVESTYRFVRSLYFRALRRALTKERFKWRLVEKAAAGLAPLAGPRELIAELRRFDDAVALLAAHQLNSVSPRLVVGQTRLKSDLDLGPSMTVIGERFLGVSFDYLGHIEQDDAVWLTVRRQKPLLIDSPASKSARNIERVARRILAYLAAPGGRLLAMRTLPDMDEMAKSRASADARFLSMDPPATLYDVLGVARTATDDEIRRAYKRQREIFREGGLPTVSVVAPDVLRKELARIEEAHDTLLDMVRRRAYDLSTFPDDAPEVVPTRTRNASQLAELAMMQAELSREINAETQFSGALLRKVRESQGVEISDIARVTKISNTHIAAIENEAPADLPAPVYVQGFVQQIARFLKLDPAQVTKTYMRRLREGTARPLRGS